MKTLKKYKRFIWLRAISELKADVRNTHIGLAWWVLDPLIYMAVFYIVFGVGLRQGGEGFVEFLLIGLVLWRWFDVTIKKAASSLVEYRGLISQIYLPKVILPSIPLISSTLRFALVYTILFTALSILGVVKIDSLVWLPVMLFAQLIFIAGLSLFFAAVVPFVPDVRRLLDYGVSLLFFMSGIFYKVDHSNELTYTIFMCNPMAFFIESNRRIILDGLVPDIGFLLAHLFTSVIFIFCASLMLKKYDKTYPLIMQ